ncbi:hypothetical protein BDE36_0356 [Arcticibacter tournemirensis]|uniref:Uncharacterized protein n=1 Tax=Arcticibacter tournemirensis TaxID=699437 RepID=A0A4Q0MEH2_9SPHI|nr:hypothetical protein [Arcticibacter tournemirensis]KAA8479079.1 hypothetical protein F1649_16835 [Arcticibacter tournemirensis]RXF71851.1 hypothetical protein EKH83_03970 [Arcticibacter tournemirensis]TQM48668.1 hypothetical protein BDE36_0356 [Arcticibacter tournemirensis]
MEQFNKDKQPEGLYFILAAICGVLTGWVATHSLLWVFVGALLGLLTAGFYLNVFVKGRHH